MLGVCCVQYGRGGWCSNSLPRQKKWQFTKMTRHIVVGEGGGQAELRNVNSFTRCKTAELNFTPRKARKSRQFWDLCGPRVKTALRPPPCAQAENQLSALFPGKRAENSDPSPATEKGRKLPKIRPQERCKNESQPLIFFFTKHHTFDLTMT